MPLKTEIDEIKAQSLAAVKAAVQFAEGSPEPDVAEVYTDVYAG